ncbi:hypothetical protein ES332_A06G169800v1 [Gossypium tomentosum]|uniref:Uncharacterized protein n=1 Tax=Gossypium tomentosum TaxID=34277 RepID=A0A5D2Q576_GOSTO|nr:hypothetical protein ES332_A06G169800v1 [Gossypium tomentosum]
MRVFRCQTTCGGLMEQRVSRRRGVGQWLNVPRVLLIFFALD